MLDARYLSLVPVVLLLGGAFIIWLGGEALGHRLKYATAIFISSVALISLAYLAFLPHPYDYAVFPWLTLRQFSLGLDYHGDGLAIYPSLFALGAGFFLFSFGWITKLTISADRLALMLASLAAFVQLLLSGNLLMLYLAGEVLVLLLAAQTAPPATEYISQGARGLLLGFHQLPGFGLLVVSLLLGLEGGNFILSLIPPATLGAGLYLLIAVVAVARGGLYPFHCWLPTALTQMRALEGGLLLVVAPLVGIYLLARFLFIAGPVLTAGPWLLALGFLSVILLSLFAFQETSPRRSLAYLVATQGAFAVVALALGAHANLWRQMLGLAVGSTWFYLGFLAVGPGGGTWERLRQGPVPWLVWLGGLSFLGLPSPTVGFGARWELFNALWSEGHFWGVGVGWLSQAVSMAVLFRMMTRSPQPAPDTVGGGWWAGGVLLFVGGLGVALGVVPGLVDGYVIAPALAGLSLGWGPEVGGVFWNLGLLMLSLPGGFLVERYGQRSLPGLGRGRLGHWLEPFSLYTAGGQGLVALARWVERGIGLIPQQPSLATALMIGLFILLFMAG